MQLNEGQSIPIPGVPYVVVPPNAPQYSTRLCSPTYKTLQENIGALRLAVATPRGGLQCAPDFANCVQDNIG